MSYQKGGIAAEGGYQERGIILHSIKYSERQLIVHILTREHGRMSYITKIASGKSNAGAQRNLFQPLFILDFEAIKSRGTIDKLNSVESTITLHNTPYDILKSSLSLFMAELLYRIVKEPVDDPRLYQYVEQSVISLDQMEEGVSNFHIWFLVHLSYFMGYGLPTRYKEGDWLDLQSGEFQSWMPTHRQRVAPQYAAEIWKFIESEAAEIAKIELNGQIRAILLDALVDYYAYHCDSFGSVRSIEVLRELF